MAENAASAGLPGPDEVLAFWFGSDLDDPEVLRASSRRWFSSDAALDAEIRERFGALLEAARAGRIAHWADGPRGALALVVVLDQFPRNIHRGSAEAFGCDALALDTCEAAIAAGHDAALHPMETIFLYMPMQHAEDAAVQTRSCALTEALVERTPEPVRPFVANSAEFALEHREIVDRFGRFPHRNAILGRAATAAEQAYLDGGGKTFGQGGEQSPGAGQDPAPG